jgi:peptide deformylase
VEKGCMNVFSSESKNIVSGEGCLSLDAAMDHIKFRDIIYVLIMLALSLIHI